MAILPNLNTSRKKKKKEKKRSSLYTTPPQVGYAGGRKGSVPSIGAAGKSTRKKNKSTSMMEKTTDALKAGTGAFTGANVAKLIPTMVEGTSNFFNRYLPATSQSASGVGVSEFGDISDIIPKKETEPFIDPQASGEGYITKPKLLGVPGVGVSEFGDVSEVIPQLTKRGTGSEPGTAFSLPDTADARDRWQAAVEGYAPNVIGDTGSPMENSMAYIAGVLLPAFAQMQSAATERGEAIQEQELRSDVEAEEAQAEYQETLAGTLGQKLGLKEKELGMQQREPYTNILGGLFENYTEQYQLAKEDLGELIEAEVDPESGEFQRALANVKDIEERMQTLMDELGTLGGVLPERTENEGIIPKERF